MGAFIRCVVVAAVLLGCSEKQAVAGDCQACPACPEAPTCSDSPSADTGDDAVPLAPAAVQSSKGSQALSLVSARFSELPGWSGDRHGEALVAFLASCRKLATLKTSAPIGVPAYAGRARDWKRACRAAKAVPSGDHAKARKMFEREFRPYAAHGSKGPQAKFSGYYVQPMRGSFKRTRRFRTPLMKRPSDLVEIQTSDFLPDGRGRRIWGQFDPSTGKLRRYPTRAQLRRKGLKPDQVLMWVDDPIDAVFAEIQGSGRAVMPDGTTVWAAFDGKNGRRFRGVGGILRRMGELKRGQGTMAGTRKWFEANPGRYHEIVDKNTAKVFFKISDRAGAVGTQDVVLTPRRSIAIDRAVIAFSTPIWVDAKAPVGKNERNIPWQRLLVAQDTGGAILGPIRGDIYWGDDKAAGDIAGHMGGKGRMWLLLPKRLNVRTRP